MLPAAGPAPLVLPILCRSCASKTPAVPCKHPNYSLENRVSIASTGYRQPIRFRPGILRYSAGIGAIPENTLFPGFAVRLPAHFSFAGNTDFHLWEW